MRTVVRRVVVAVVVLHGVIHLAGVTRGFGWGGGAGPLRAEVGATMAWAWLAAAVAVVTSGVLAASRVRWWWAVGVPAAVGSQAVIATAWSDAKAGTMANAVLLAAALHGFAVERPGGLRGSYRRRAADATASVAAVGAPVTEDEVARLPGPVATFVRRSGAVGRPHVRACRVDLHGRIRGGADRPWMPFRATETLVCGDDPVRLFAMDATMVGLPVDVLHVYRDGAATMRARAAGLKTVVDASGADMDRSETVTVFNDLCVFAPAALVDAPVAWTVLDERRVRGTFSGARHTVTAELVFDALGDLVDFVSDDRSRATPDGRSFVPQRWSTPLGHERTFGGRRLAGSGTARWHAPAPEGTFTYLEVELDDVRSLPADTSAPAAPASATPAAPPPAPVLAGRAG